MRKWRAESVARAGTGASPGAKVGVRRVWSARGCMNGASAACQETGSGNAGGRYSGR